MKVIVENVQLVVEDDGCIGRVCLVAVSCLFGPKKPCYVAKLPNKYLEEAGCT